MSVETMTTFVFALFFWCKLSQGDLPQLLPYPNDPRIIGRSHLLVDWSHIPVHGISMDRVAFGAAPAALMLSTVAAAVPTGPTVVIVVKGTKSLVWTVGAVVGLLAAVRGQGQKKGQREMGERAISDSPCSKWLTLRL